MGYLPVFHGKWDQNREFKSETTSVVVWGLGHVCRKTRKTKRGSNLVGNHRLILHNPNSNPILTVLCL